MSLYDSLCMLVLYCITLRCIALQCIAAGQGCLPAMSPIQCLGLQGTVVHKSHAHLLTTPHLPPQQRKRCASKTSRQQQCRPSVTHQAWSHSNEIGTKRGTRRRHRCTFHKIKTRGFKATNKFVNNCFGVSDDLEARKKECCFVLTQQCE